jgi:hypothetical protein
MLERRKTKWSELSPAGRRAVVALGTVQIVLQAAMLWDLHRRPDRDVRGNRRWWTAASFVNFVGPIAYLVVGRRHPARRHGPSA